MFKIKSKFILNVSITALCLLVVAAFLYFGKSVLPTNSYSVSQKYTTDKVIESTVLVANDKITTQAEPSIYCSGAVYISGDFAEIESDVTTDGTHTLITRGVVYSTVNTQPNVDDDSFVAEAGSSGLSITYIDALTPNTYYYARAYLEFDTGLVYSNDCSFTTIDPTPTETPTDTPTDTPVPTPTLEGTTNIAPFAIDYTCSSGDCNYVADGASLECNLGEWFTDQPLPVYVRMDWDTPQTISRIRLYDRMCPEYAESGTIEFGDSGSTSTTWNIPEDNGLVDVDFTPKEVTWIRVNIAAASGGSNHGFNEIEVHTVPLDVTPTETPTPTPTPTLVPVALTTSPATDITTTTAIVSGEIVPADGYTIFERGIVYSSESAVPDVDFDSVWSTGSSTGVFSETLESLTPSTFYYARAYVIYDSSVAYGDVITFTTLAPATAPSVLTLGSAASLTTISAKISGNVTSDGGDTVTARGVVFSSSNATPTLADTTVTVSGTVGNFAAQLTGLTPNTLYYVRAYATNTVDTTYANILTFTTFAEVAPEQFTTNLTYPGANELATDSSGNVYAAYWDHVNKFSSDGTLLTTVGEYGNGVGQFRVIEGLVFDEDDNLYVSDSSLNKIVKYQNDGTYITEWGIQPETSWSRGMASDKAGNIYVGTLTCIQKYTTAGTFVLAMGDCVTRGYQTAEQFWAPQDLVIYEGTLYILDGDDSVKKYLLDGTYVSMTVLGFGSAHGQFYTATGMALDPQGRLLIADDGNNRVQIMSTNLTYISQFGSGSTLSSPIAVAYHNGYAYVASDDVFVPNIGYISKFMILTSPVVATINPASAITKDSATISGIVSTDGGAAITERGMIYSVSNSTPTVDSGIKTAISGTTGIMSTPLTGLTANTTYYFRAYAINSNGTSYGNVLTFKTLTSVPTTLKNVYFTFGKLRYGRYATPSQMRTGDMIYLKNYNPKQVKLLAISLYDYKIKGNQCYSRTWRSSTSMYMKTCGLLPTKRQYAFIFTFKDLATGVTIKKYFVVNTISSGTVTY
jgi:sugar lactone lactonase YvrE